MTVKKIKNNRILLIEISLFFIGSLLLDIVATYILNIDFGSGIAFSTLLFFALTQIIIRPSIDNFLKYQRLTQKLPTDFVVSKNSDQDIKFKELIHSFKKHYLFDTSFHSTSIAIILSVAFIGFLNTNTLVVQMLFVLASLYTVYSILNKGLLAKIKLDELEEMADNIKISKREM